MANNTDSDRINLETLKLLVSVAWADHEIAHEESEHIFALVAQLGLGDEDANFLRRTLRDEGRLPAPDLTLLREHRDTVLAGVDALIAVDRKIVPDELAARSAIERLLDRG